MNTDNPASSEKSTIIEEGTGFKGAMVSSCPIDVRGRIEGELEAPSMTVSASGAVHGRAKVGVIRSDGELSGEFDAEQLVLAGVVKDSTVIRARSLEVKLSSTRGKLQVVFGECELAVGDEPTEYDAVEAEEVEPKTMAPEPEMSVAMNNDAAEAPGEVANDIAEAARMASETALDRSARGEKAEAGEKKKRKRNGAEEPARSGWSEPPSVPPPDN